MSSFLKDSHSHARPDLAVVTDIHLDLFVDFNRHVLKGQCVLTIIAQPGINEVILDIHRLTIFSVTDFFDYFYLKYNIEKFDYFGNKLTIQLPQLLQPNENTNTDHSHKATTHKIQIEYETSPYSPALYWLTREQTSDGICSFLLSYSKYMYARAMFPCQDTPSVKSKYSAMISAPKCCTVRMSLHQQKILKVSHQYVCEFSQKAPLPSYVIVIVVGFLQCQKFNNRCNVLFEMKYSTQQVFRMVSNIKKLMHVAESIYGAYPWGKYDICVLPPNIPKIDIACPKIIFVSPSLLDGDLSLISTLTPTICQNWIGSLVTCVTFEHLWLHKSISMFFWIEIVRILLGNETKRLLQQKLSNDLWDKKEDKFHDIKLKCLIPHFTDFFLYEDEMIEYVPYEKGVELLNCILDSIGGFTEFERFLKSFIRYYKYNSISSDEFKKYLYNYFPKKWKSLNSLELDKWFYQENFGFPVGKAYTDKCHILARKWLRYPSVGPLPDPNCNLKYYNDLQKIAFLSYLHESSRYLPISKIEVMSRIYSFHTCNTEIRFIWIRLCIKSHWREIIPQIYRFIDDYHSSTYICTILQDLYHWESKIAFCLYSTCKSKMSFIIQEKLDEFFSFLSDL